MGRCVIGEGLESCYTFGYSPADDPNVVAVAALIADAEDIPSEEVRPFASVAEANQYLRLNPNSTQGVFHVQFDYGCDDGMSFFLTAILSYLNQFLSKELCYVANNRTLDDIVGVSYILQYNTTPTSVNGRVRLHRDY